MLALGYWQSLIMATAVTAFGRKADMVVGTARITEARADCEF
jgi:hypothetical protein